MDFPEAKFSLYFLALDSPNADGHGKTWTDREGILELTHNHGTESDPNYQINNGNGEQFKDIAFTVDNLHQTCANLEASGVRFQKRLNEGRSNAIAFALDPDGYWVELLSLPAAATTNAQPNKESFRFNHTMLRVRNPEHSLQFYRSVLGMSLLRVHEVPEANFNLYYLAYRRAAKEHEDHEALSQREGILQLTWNYGTEIDGDFKGYHNGNDQPQGFGHICISVDDLDEACSRFEDLQVNWKKRLTDGRMKNVAFILDPDGYWVEYASPKSTKVPHSS
ncbi:Glyoxalase/Bleomycin resistance protein/Dihydroxybiphenyl dioxygenase [Peziza echinospora]|nr:Glyoxalase/Bleomycin resistance protein/Dihydroxybiphenyl dioxygenase [Peziza echinospora]